ncbi:uncharacterized protein LOC120628321 [Pararge aegeria]|uniref:uncharacterized protein LOC120628321 n=1 Tax=Pararge aegeria TaxID=116150 RepID=UPI0019CFBAB4|nr:uncharacterized protein LOC120628321 [Pararge aegeria]
MKHNIISCLYFIFFVAIFKCEAVNFKSRAGYGTVDSFEFVPIVNFGEVTFSTSGKIGLLEKNVRVPIVIPSCSDLTYVRVDVDNTVGPPYVTMDFNMRTVIIKYRTGQYSVSSFVVTAKSVPKSHC